MATTNKTEKKPAAKTAAKKPAAKTAAKPAAKTAAKKPAAKADAKPAAKKPAAKTAAKPAAKTAAKKPAAKADAKPAAKKPAAKTIEKAAPKPVAKPAAAKPKKSDIPDAKFRNLFDAYTQGKLPFAQGYIVSSFFDEKSAYSIYEVVSYAGVKEIYSTGTGLTFVTGGKKLYVLLEPDTYRLKHQEPVYRQEGERIPKRYNELEIIIAKNQTKIMFSQKPDETFGSFTILKPSGLNFSIVFYELPDMYKTLAEFFVNTLNKQRKVPEADAKKAAIQIVKTIEKYMSFETQFT